MFAQAGIFLITTVGGLFTLALLLRFMLQLLRAPSRNQISLFVAALTDFVVRPARRLIPGLWGIDLSTLVLAWLSEVLQIWLVLEIKGYEFGPAIGTALVALASLATVHIAKLAIYVVMVAVVMQAVLSWVNPFNPLAPLLTSLTRPFLRPFQQRVPLVGGVDMSPLFVLVICQLLLMAPLLWLETQAVRWL